MLNRSAACAVTCVILIHVSSWAEASTCTDIHSSSTITESFDTRTYRASTTTVDGWGASPQASINIYPNGRRDATAAGTLTLARQGGIYGSGGIQPTFANVYATAAGDFNNDGYVDLMGVQETTFTQYGQPMYRCAIRFFWNSSGGLFWLDPTFNYKIEEDNDHCGRKIFLVSGNLNNDSMPDLLVGVNTVGVVQLYTEATVLLATSTSPTFSIADMPTIDDGGFYAPSWNIGASMSKLIDWDGDGDDDWLVASAYNTRQHLLLFTNNGSGTFSGQTVLYEGLGFFTPSTICASGKILPTITPTCKTTNASDNYSFGATVLLADDFDGNGETDVIIGSSSEKYLTYFKRQWGVFSVQPDILFAPGGAHVGDSQDIDGDGDIDLILGHRGGVCDGTVADDAVYIYLNDGLGNFTMKATALSTDTTRLINWVKIFDAVPDTSNSTLDILVGYNDREVGYVSLPASPTAAPYVSPGYAYSNVYSGATPDNGIVSVTITSLTKNQPTGTSIKYYVSNNAGINWEEFTATEMATLPATHSFSSYGTALRWKFVLTGQAYANQGAVPGGYPLATSASNTPTISDLQFTYAYDSATSQQYSRSGLAAGYCRESTSEPTWVDCIFSAAYIYPGFKGHLYANDISSIANASFTRSSSQSFNSSGSLKFDSGYRLSIRDWTSRSIRSETGPSALLKQVKAMNPTVFGYDSGDTASRDTLAAFVSNGMGSQDWQPWKLFDPGHSSPLWIGAPTADSAYMDKFGPTSGPGSYAQYKIDNASRYPTMYIGANDGMLHSFNTTGGGGGPGGYENWGVVPPNLLAKLKLQYYLAPGATLPNYIHNFYVDGPLVTADIQVGTTWRTTIIAGQGQGSGANGNNYYFALALNVVNPTSRPDILWEFSEGWDGTCTTSCSPIMGETWSKPVVTRVNVAGVPTWVVFFGSGYSNMPAQSNVGQRLYMLNAATGAKLGSWDVTDIPVSPTNPSTISNTLPGGPAVVDINDDGYADRLYIGDLEGRLWKLDMQTSPTIAAWTWQVLFDAGQPNGTGTRLWAPITTAPAVALVNSTSPNVYFGTGGDDNAPDNVNYAFYSIQDIDAVGVVRANPITEDSLSTSRYEWKVVAAVGDKYWSDPVIANSSVIYFTSLQGDIESVNPCLNDDTTGKLFGYAIRDFKDPNGISYTKGTSVLVNASNVTIPWMQTAHKVRRSVLLRSWITASPYMTIRPVDYSTLDKPADQVIFQEFGGNGTQPPTITGILHSGVVPTPKTGSKVKILRWREML